MPADVITWVKELAESITSDGSDLGQEVEEHHPGVAAVMPSDFDDKAAEVMTVDTNAGNEGVLNVDNVDIQYSNHLVDSNHLVEPIPVTQHNSYLQFWQRMVLQSCKW